MKIAILSSASAGGAGIAAYRIYEALKSVANCKVDFFDMSVLGQVPSEISPARSGTNEKITNTHFSIDHASDSRDWVVNLLSDYDVINVHWASYLVSLSELYELAKKGKKIVFTLHDFYYITGGCHYPAGCLGFLKNCLSCPQINEELLPRMSVIRAQKLKRKIFSFPNVHLAAPSKFIVDNAINSGIVPSTRAHVLRNAYEPLIPIDYKNKSLEKSLLLIADSFDEQRKGLRLAVEAIKIVARTLKTENRKFQLHLAGEVDGSVVQELDGMGIEIFTYGKVKKHEELVDILVQCQYILSCSYEDNWPNILVESASYGCIPIVGSWHGCEEFVNAFEAGYVSDKYSPESFATEILRAFSIPSVVRGRQAMELMEKVREAHSYARIVKGYKHIFSLISEAYEKDHIEVAENQPLLFSSKHVVANLRLEGAKLMAGKEGYKLAVRTKLSPFGSQESENEEVVFFGEEKQGHEITMRRLGEMLKNDGYGLSAYELIVRK